jgi:cation transport ATPase
MRLLAASLGSASSHPVSRAARQAAGAAALPGIAAVREAGGFGVTGMIGDEVVAFGRPDLFVRLGVSPSAVPAHEGPIAGLSRGGIFLGWLLFADQPRAEAAEALAGLRRLGLGRQMLLTGDRAAVAAKIAVGLGIVEVQSDALPEAKMRRVLAEAEAGYRPLVVGDGINDSLALKAGAVGIAMGAQGTDVALASADLVLMSSDLRRLGTAVRLSRRCRQCRTRPWLDAGADGAGGHGGTGCRRCRGGRVAAQSLDVPGRCQRRAPDAVRRALKVKVLCFFLSRKKSLSSSNRKEAKDL